MIATETPPRTLGRGTAVSADFVVVVKPPPKIETTALGLTSGRELPALTAPCVEMAVLATESSSVGISKNLKILALCVSLSGFTPSEASKGFDNLSQRSFRSSSPRPSDSV